MEGGRHMADQIWYKIRRHSGDVTPYWVTRETPAKVIYLDPQWRQKPVTELKKSDYHVWFKDWAEAVKYLIEKAEGRVEAAKSAVASAEANLELTRKLDPQKPLWPKEHKK